MQVGGLTERGCNHPSLTASMCPTCSCDAAPQSMLRSTYHNIGGSRQRLPSLYSS